MDADWRATLSCCSSADRPKYRSKHSRCFLLGDKMGYQVRPPLCVQVRAMTAMENSLRCWKYLFICLRISSNSPTVSSVFVFRGRPDGTFFVRRKGPSLLVLTYVALSRRANSNANTPSSGGKHRHKGSPARLSSPPPPTSRMRDAFGSPVGDNKSGRRATVGPGKDYLSDNTMVQVWRHDY